MAHCLLGCMSVLPRHRIDIEKPLLPGMAELVWMEVGNFCDLTWLLQVQPVKYDGDAKKPGTTRTYRSGDVEKLLSYDEVKRSMTWSRNTLPEYEGGIRVSEEKVAFWIQARCPMMLLESEEATTDAQLEAVVWSAQQRLKESKVLISIRRIPMKDCSGYAKMAAEREAPALKKLMAGGDLLQARFELDTEERVLHAYEVWKDAETQTHHYTEGVYRDLAADIALTFDLASATGEETHSWSEEFGPKFMEYMQRAPSVLHRNGDCTVFHFRNAMDAGRDNLILHTEMLVKPECLEECRHILAEMQILAREPSKAGDLQDARFHLDQASSRLCILQVFDSLQGFGRLVVDSASPYRATLDRLASLADGQVSGCLWGPSYADSPGDRVKDYCSERGIRLCKAHTLELLGSKQRLTPLPMEVQYYSNDTKERVHALLDKLDRYTSTILNILPRRVLNSIRSLETEPYIVREPHLTHTGVDEVKIGGLPFVISKADDYFGSQTLMDRILFGVLSSPTLFPIEDKFVEVPDDLVDCMKAELLFSRIIPPPDTFFPEISSDAAVERAIMSGVFSVWLKDDPDGDLVVDYSRLADFTPRTGFRRLGAKAYLSSAGKLTSIYVCDKQAMVRPGEPGWDDAKVVFKNSGALWNTTVDHLIGVHMIATNPVVNSAVKTLPTTHTIRRLLQPFSFRSVYVNQRSQKSLLDSHSIVLHACGIDADTFAKFLEAGAMKSELWLTPHERMAQAGKKVQALATLGQFPYGEDSMLLYDALYEFVSDWVDDEYADDEVLAADAALQAFGRDLYEQTRLLSFGTPERLDTRDKLSKVLATFIFNATGQHEHAGTVQEYIGHPSFMGFRLTEGSRRVDMQSWLLGQMLFCVTSLPMPKLMDDFDECFTKDAERKRWRACQERLAQVSSAIDSANNTRRPYPFRSFLPRVLESSVNV
mmetsp:Transcript_11372/g.32764  ORF Transcript_11372/g.32764 Transcript_11372/m.32764 type:complete len:938 (+) Transcript_11372:90-2903(+)